MAAPPSRRLVEAVKPGAKAHTEAREALPKLSEEHVGRLSLPLRTTGHKIGREPPRDNHSNGPTY
jgi:hypothetical protein